MQAGVAPHEALLLNSLRQLLSAAPVMESTLEGWCLAGRKERRRANSRPNSREGAYINGVGSSPSPFPSCQVSAPRRPQGSAAAPTPVTVHTI